MNAALEAHLHLLVCIDRINGAWRTLKLIEENRGHPLVGAAFRYALVEYATAFTRSDGQYEKYKFLPEECVPSEHATLHQRIIDARHQVHAHADLKVLEADLEVQYINGAKHVSHVQNYIHGLEELQNLSSVVKLVEAVLDKVYGLQRESKKNLEP